MNKKTVLILLAAIVLVAVAVPVKRILSGHQYPVDAYWQTFDASSTSEIDHSLWQDLLDEYLITDDESGVNLLDYESLAEEAPEQLNKYIQQLTSADIRKNARDEQFAYWVNLYNALTVKLIIENYPTASIKDISSGALSLGPWDDVATSIHGRDITLNDIEHRILRPIWKDHRIHFAVNCASIGCPDLQDEAFTADNAEELLDKAARDYLQHPRGLALTVSGLQLSSIFDWYQSDFGENEAELLATLKPYLSEDNAKKLTNWSGKASYHYDWSLNEAN